MIKKEEGKKIVSIKLTSSNLSLARYIAADKGITLSDFFEEWLNQKRKQFNKKGN